MKKHLTWSISSVVQMCKAIDNPTTGNDTFAKLYGAAKVYYNSSGTVKCFDIDDDSDPHGLNGWEWQVQIHLKQLPF